MATLERGLGRGLDSLLRSSRDAETAPRDIKKLALAQLVPGVHQPRRWFDDAALAELSASIKNQGVVQPLIVRPKADTSPQLYEIVAGERRWRAAKLAGLTEVPVVITAYTDAEAMTVALVENLQRENLNPLEEADALQALRSTYNLSQEELAAKLGKSRSAIANALRLLQLPKAAQQALVEGKISAGHARSLLAVTDEATQTALFAMMMETDLSVREAEAAVECWKKTGALPPSQTLPRPPRADRPKASRKTPGIKEIQNSLRSVVHHGASISGTEDKGKIALPYTSRGELAFLLSLLGVRSEMEECGEPEAPQEAKSDLQEWQAAMKPVGTTTTES